MIETMMNTSPCFDLESFDSKDVIEIPSMDYLCSFNASSLPDQSQGFLGHGKSFFLKFFYFGETKNIWNIFRFVVNLCRVSWFLFVILVFFWWDDFSCHGKMIFLKKFFYFSERKINGTFFDSSLSCVVFLGSFRNSCFLPMMHVVVV